jgi:transposase
MAHYRSTPVKQLVFVICIQTIERLWARLKEWRAVATRYEKTAQSFMGVLCLAAAIDGS